MHLASRYSLTTGEALAALCFQLGCTDQYGNRTACTSLEHVASEWKGCSVPFFILPQTQLGLHWAERLALPHMKLAGLKLLKRQVVFVTASCCDNILHKHSSQAGDLL